MHKSPLPNNAGYVSGSIHTHPPELLNHYVLMQQNVGKDCRIGTARVHDEQLLLNKQQQIWGGVYYPLTFFEQYRFGNLAECRLLRLKNYSFIRRYIFYMHTCERYSNENQSTEVHHNPADTIDETLQ